MDFCRKNHQINSIRNESSGIYTQLSNLKIKINSASKSHSSYKKKDISYLKLLYINYNINLIRYILQNTNYNSFNINYISIYSKDKHQLDSIHKKIKSI